MQVWLCCWANGLLCSPSDPGQGSVGQAGPFPCAQTSQLALAMTLQYITARLCNDAPLDCPMPGTAPGGHPALGCSVTFLHLLWRANGIVGCWVMPALNGSTNTCLCRWAGPGRGWQSVNLCLFVSFLVRTSALCLILGSWPLLSHSETAACFPME